MQIWLVLFLMSSSVFAERTGMTFGDDSQEMHYDIARVNEPLENRCEGMQPASYESGDPDKFVSQCTSAGVDRRLCINMTAPNIKEIRKFRCTYPGKPHVLVPTDTKMWKNAFKLAGIVQAVSEKEGVCVDGIYNFWRPEPYNTRVEGAANRHPGGTAIDVKFCDANEAVRMIREVFCPMYKSGELQSLGDYGGGKVHLGIKGTGEAHTSWGPHECD